MKALVITTINSPTAAISAYRNILREPDWTIIVVGDAKTPPDFFLDGVDYLSVERQQALFGRLATLIPLNHYSRKNFGYIYAMGKGVDAIAETDDDNIPYDDIYPNFLTRYIRTPLFEATGVFNIYSYFTDKGIWPRGLPLDTVRRSVSRDCISEKEVTASIQQALVNLDPDVDAIYRLTVSQGDIAFEPNKTLALSNGSYAPINTQNTLFYKEAFPLLLLPISVSSRVTDIWRGYIAQRLLWTVGARLVFLSPSVYQRRNAHVLMKDFLDELPLYTKVHELIAALDGFSTESTNLCENMSRIYNHLNNKMILSNVDVNLCELWIETIRRLTYR